MKSGQTKYCDKCNGTMEEKLLFTSYYFECKKCTFAQELSTKGNMPVTRNLEDGRHIGFTPGSGQYNPQPHVYKAPAPGNYHVAIGGSGGSGGSGRQPQSHQGLAAPYGQAPNPYLYPRDKPSECGWCAHKLACSCISFLVNGKKHHHVLVGYIEGVFLQAGDYLEFKDSYLNYTVPAKGMYLIKNFVGVPVITVQP